MASFPIIIHQNRKVHVESVCVCVCVCVCRGGGLAGYRGGVGMIVPMMGLMTTDAGLGPRGLILLSGTPLARKFSRWPRCIPGKKSDHGNRGDRGRHNGRDIPPRMGEALWAKARPPNPRAPVLLVHLEPQRLVGGGSSGRPPPSLAFLECCALVAGVFRYCLSLTFVPVAVGRGLGQTLVLAAAAACY